MIPREILAKVRRIEITTSRRVTDLFAGQYHSVFKGQGIEFDEVREYQIGDDIRSIDWNVTARTGRPHVKKFVEEREMTVMIVVDASLSNFFGTTKQLKSDLAAEIAAVLATSAIRNNDRVGLIIVTDRIEKFIPPRKGLKHILRVIREILCFTPQGKGTDISAALEYLSKVTTRKTVSFIISDFLDGTRSPSGSYEYRFKKTMAVANKRHDLIAISLTDPRELMMPSCGIVSLEDAETGRRMLVDFSDATVRARYAQEAQKRVEMRRRLFRSLGIDHIDLATDVPYDTALIRFFKQRQRRIRA